MDWLTDVQSTLPGAQVSVVPVPTAFVEFQVLQWNPLAAVRLSGKK